MHDRRKRAEEMQQLQAYAATGARQRVVRHGRNTYMRLAETLDLEVPARMHGEQEHRAHNACILVNGMSVDLSPALVR